MSALDGSKLDLSALTYSAMKPHASGSKVVNLVNKNTKETFCFSTPLILTWGAQESKDPATGKLTGKFTVALQFPSEEYKTPALDGFLESMKQLEAKIKADALTYSKDWFGKTITSSEVMEEKFNSMLKYPKKEKGGIELDFSRPPSLTVKLPCWKGAWQTEIFDEARNPLFVKRQAVGDPCDFLKPKTHILCLVESGGLWFGNGKCSITFNLKQAIVQKPKTSAITDGVCFLKPSSEEVQALKSLPPPEDDIIVDATIVNDSDDDDDDDRELPAPPKVVPAPAPVVSTMASTSADEPEPKKKKTIVKKPKATADA